MHQRPGDAVDVRLLTPARRSLLQLLIDDSEPLGEGVTNHADWSLPSVREENQQRTHKRPKVRSRHVGTLTRTSQSGLAQRRVEGGAGLRLRCVSGPPTRHGDGLSRARLASVATAPHEGSHRRGRRVRSTEDAAAAALMRGARWRGHHVGLVQQRPSIAPSRCPCSPSNTSILLLRRCSRYVRKACPLVGCERRHRGCSAHYSVHPRCTRPPS
jgi:hypothetical protein